MPCIPCFVCVGQGRLLPAHRKDFKQGLRFSLSCPKLLCEIPQSICKSSLASQYTHISHSIYVIPANWHASNSGCFTYGAADYDLTGQILWPAAMLLAGFLAANIEIMASSQAACELGAGLGLTGLLCGQYCDIVMADHNAIVLRVLQENIQGDATSYKVRCRSKLPKYQLGLSLFCSTLLFSRLNQ